MPALPESMSDGFDRPPLEPGHTRPDLCTDQRSQSVSQPSAFQRVVHTLHFAWRKWVFVVRPTDWTSVAQDLFRWFQALSRGQDTAGGTENASGPFGIPLKRGCLRRKAINLAPPKRVYEPMWLADTYLSALDMNAGFPESMSDCLDQVPNWARTQPTRSVYRQTWPTEVCPSPTLGRNLPESK